MLNFPEETILSTIKIRQAGFADCIDTHQSFKLEQYNYTKPTVGRCRVITLARDSITNYQSEVK